MAVIGLKTFSSRALAASTFDPIADRRLVAVVALPTPKPSTVTTVSPGGGGAGGRFEPDDARRRRRIPTYAVRARDGGYVASLRASPLPTSSLGFVTSTPPASSFAVSAPERVLRVAGTTSEGWPTWMVLALGAVAGVLATLAIARTRSAGSAANGRRSRSRSLAR